MNSKSYWMPILLILFSCSSEIGNYGGYKVDYDNALDYYIMLDKGNHLNMRDNNLDKQKNGTIVTFHSGSGKKESFLVGKGTRIIDSYVIPENISYNETFVLVDQKPLIDICECNDQCFRNKYKNWEQMPTYKLCEEGLKKSKIHMYWIIDKKKDHVFGPLTKEQFLNKRIELGIPKSLRINLN